MAHRVLKAPPRLRQQLGAQDVAQQVAVQLAQVVQRLVLALLQRSVHSMHNVHSS